MVVIYVVMPFQGLAKSQRYMNKIYLMLLLDSDSLC